MAVRALCDEGHDGREYVLTGPASLTQREQVQIIGDAIGRPLRFEELSRASAREQMLAMFPPPVADMLLNAYEAAVGQPALVTSTIAEVTGCQRVRSSTGRGTTRLLQNPAYLRSVTTLEPDSSARPAALTKPSVPLTHLRL